LGALDVELVGGQADDDFGDSILQRALVGGWGEVEAAAGAAGVGVGCGLAVGVVEVAEGFAAEGGGAAAVLVGEAVVAGGAGSGLHGWGLYTPLGGWGTFGLKVLRGIGMRPDLWQSGLPFPGLGNRD
jgi:hypothetical protein